MLANLLGLQNLNIPAAMLGPLVQAILDDAKTFGYNLVASRQTCDDLMEGIFVGGKPEAEGFTFGKLVDAYKTEEALQKWVRDRSIEAADRGFEGTASDKITKGSADVVYEKCYAYVLGGWRGLRKQLYDEVRRLWSIYGDRGADLVAQPEPAYLDPITGKVTVQVTAGSKAQQEDKDKGYPNEKALQALGLGSQASQAAWCGSSFCPGVSHRTPSRSTRPSLRRALHSAHRVNTNSKSR